MVEWFLWTLVAFGISKEIIAGYKGFDFSKPTLDPKKPIDNGRIYSAFAFFGSSQWVLASSNTLDERIFLILIGTLPICVIAFCIGYFSVKK